MLMFMVFLSDTRTMLSIFYFSTDTDIKQVFQVSIVPVNNISTEISAKFSTLTTDVRTKFQVSILQLFNCFQVFQSRHTSNDVRTMFLNK